MEQQVDQELIGTVVFLNENDGSKSECVSPFLYLGRGVPPRRVMMENDNPFENRGFAPYDGLVVKVVGHEGRGGVFLVDRVMAPFEPLSFGASSPPAENEKPESPCTGSIQTIEQVSTDNK